MAVLKDLIVHGASRFLGGINTDSVKANTIDATNGYFKYLKAIDGDIENLSVQDLLAQKATVVGLLDVKGELHTNKWTNTNIANIGGVFYISPTVISTTATVVIGGSANSRTLTVSGGSFATTTVPTWNGTSESTSAWVIGSRVMVTGSITYNNVEYPLGTCTGYISGALSSTGFTVQQIYSEALEDIFSIVGTASLVGSNIQISMYEIGPGNNNNQSNNASYKPVGILMTSYGMADKSTHIDIYGGVNAKNTSSKTSGMADPNVRIGYLGGLDSYTDSAGNTRQPTGWGIYTDNGFFKGVVVADSGSIGHFTIDSNSIYSGSHSAYNSNNAGIFLGRPSSSSSDYYIAGGPQALWYLKSDGSAKIGAMTLSSAGVLAVPAANISGTLTASQVDVSGIITTGSIVTNTLTGGTFNTTDYIRVSTQASSSLTIGTSGAKTDWRIIAGKTFGVDKSGNLYATSVNITGALTATSLTISSGATIGGDGASQILNSDIEVGGRNLVLRTGTMPAVSNGVNGFRASGGTATHIDISSPPIAGITGGIRVTNSGSSAARIGMAQDHRTNTFVTGEIYSEGFWIRASSSFTSQITIQPVWISSSQWASIDAFSVNLTTNWQYIKGEGAVLKGTQANSYSCGYVYASNVPAGGWIEICGLKLEKGNKATDWTPAPEDVEVDIYEASTKATSYITYVSATEGIKVHNSGDTTDYVQVNSSAIKMYRNNVEKMLLDDSSFRIGSIGSNKRNLYITDSAVQIRNNTVVLAEYGSITKFYDGNGVADSNIAAQIGADGLDIIKGHIGDWTIENGDIKYSAGVSETSPTISLTKQSTSNLRSIASIDASSSSETNPNSGARISVFYESYNSNTQTWQGDFAGCYIIPDKISLLSLQGRSLIEPNTISVGGSSPTSTIESVSTGGGAFIQANSAASEADVKAMSGAGTIYIYSSNNGNRGMYGTNSSNTGHSIIDVTNTNASYFRGQATSVSDLKKKDVIEEYDWKIDEFISGLKPIAFRRIHDDGTLGDRIRMGFGAQDIRDLTRSLYKEELSLYQAKLIDNTKEGTERESSDYHGEETDDKNLSWSLTYEELIAPMVLEIQRLMDRVNKLESEIKVLKS